MIKLCFVLLSKLFQQNCWESIYEQEMLCRTKMLTFFIQKNCFPDWFLLYYFHCCLEMNTSKWFLFYCPVKIVYSSKDNNYSVIDDKFHFFLSLKLWIDVFLVSNILLSSTSFIVHKIIKTKQNKIYLVKKYIHKLYWKTKVVRTLKQI